MPLPMLAPARACPCTSLTARYPIHMTQLSTLIALLPTWMLAEVRVRKTCSRRGAGARGAGLAAAGGCGVSV